MTETLYTKDSPEPPADVVVLKETNETNILDYLVRVRAGWAWSDQPVTETSFYDCWEDVVNEARSPLRVYTPTEPRSETTAAPGFITLDSGTRATFPSGMQRDTQSGKPRYDLIPIWFIRELAELMARGAEKYGDKNWELADSPAEADRMDASGLRHHFQYLEGDKTENHLAATVFNLFAAEQTRRKVGSNE